jgi:outer membrane immunogenic protein
MLFLVAWGIAMRLLPFLAFAIIASGPSFAADLPFPAAPATSYSVSSLQTWSGFYVGVNGGYGFGKSSWSDDNNPGSTLVNPFTTTSPGTNTGDFSVSGPLAGLTGGLTYQLNALAFGIEGDIDWSGLKGSAAPANGFCNLPVTSSAAGLNCQTKLEWLSTIRARVGYANDFLFVYATAGGAFGTVGAAITGVGVSGSPGASGVSQTNTAFGWTGGAGIEWAFLENFSVKAEYLFVDLGHVSCNMQLSCGVDGVNPFSGAPTAANSSVSLTENIIRVGINYRFAPF